MATDINKWAAVCEAVPEIDEPPMIYWTTIHGGRDDPVGYAESRDPMRALELFAKSAGIVDYSLDQSQGRLVLCPAHSLQRWYVYA